MPAAVVLTFEGLRDAEQILSFHNGGFGGGGSGPGPGFGITFGVFSFTGIDSDAGGGNIANEPSPSTVASFLQGLPGGAVMNVAAGFTGASSFFYTSSQAGNMTVWDAVGGAVGGGGLLATIGIRANAFGSCPGDPTGSFACWNPSGSSAASARSDCFRRHYSGQPHTWYSRTSRLRPASHSGEKMKNRLSMMFRQQCRTP